MAPRPFWKGYLKLSLVTCPVAMTPATTENAKVRFHVLNRRTGNRVVSRYVDAGDGAEIEEDDLAKAYAKGEDDYVVIEDEELESIALESTKTIDIERFAPEESVDWIWYDRPHYLFPDDPVGEEAFAVIRDAMNAASVVGLSRLVLYRRERPVLLKPRDKGIMLWTLRYADDIRPEQEYFGANLVEKPEPEAVELVEKLIEKMKARWDAGMMRDPTQEKLLEIIASKRKGAKKRAKAAEPAGERPSNVVNIIDALRKSIRAER